jgi:hypothetical protein
MVKEIRLMRSLRNMPLDREAFARLVDEFRREAAV